MKQLTRTLLTLSTHWVTIHGRGGLNPPDNTPRGVSVGVFGRI